MALEGKASPLHIDFANIPTQRKPRWQFCQVMLNFYIKWKSVLFDAGKRGVRKSFPNSAEWQAQQTPSAPGFLILFECSKLLYEICSHLKYDLLLVKSFKWIMKIQEWDSQCNAVNFVALAL